MRKTKKASSRSRSSARRSTKRSVRRAVRKSVSSSRKSTSSSRKPSPAQQETKNNFELRANKLIQKGRDRGFVTYDEILKEFPQIENDVMFLEELYAKFGAANVDVLEGGGLLEVEELKEKKQPGHISRGSDSAYDSIQMYLREIGKYPLINAHQEKELAKRIQAGDKEAVNLLANANLRLVVSIAKKYVGRSPDLTLDRKSTRLNSSHVSESRMPSSA